VVAKLLEMHEVVAAMFHGFDYSKIFSDNPAERLGVVAAAMNFILQADEEQGKTDKPDGLKSRFMNEVLLLSKAFALAFPHEKAVAIRDEVGLFQAVRAGLAKYTPTGEKSADEIDTAIRQLVSKA